MNRKNKFLIAFILFNTLFSASGIFDGWGNPILGHVADSNDGKYLIDLDGDGKKETLYITKHVMMLLISAFVTALLSILATKKYRKNIHATPSGISQIFEILFNFINKEIVIPNIGEKYNQLQSGESKCMRASCTHRH